MTTGSITRGTLRPEDLIPRFAETLQHLVESRLKDLIENPPPDFDYQWDACISILKDLGRLDGNLDYDSYWEEDGHVDDLKWLNNRLNDFAPAGHYFGAHPGDGSDFGFW
jgi:hypothetical protein